MHAQFSSVLPLEEAAAAEPEPESIMTKLENENKALKAELAAAAEEEPQEQVHMGVLGAGVSFSLVWAIYVVWLAPQPPCHVPCLYGFDAGSNHPVPNPEALSHRQSSEDESAMVKALGDRFAIWSISLHYRWIGKREQSTQGGHGKSKIRIG